MNARSARKIVQRVEKGSVNHKSYPLHTVERAFLALGKTLTEDMRTPWTTEAARKAEIAENRPAREAAAAARRADKAARLEAKAKAKEANRERIRGLEADRKNRELAAAAGREAFKEAIENEVDELPESVEVVHEVADETVGEPDNTYAEMSVKELKAECKSRGLKGYSSLKRPELTAMLVVDDQNDGL